MKGRQELRYLKERQAERRQDTSAVVETVAEMLAAIEERGDDAVREYSRKLDGWDPPSFRVTDDEIRALGKSLSTTFIEDTLFAQNQVRNFARMQRERLNDFETETIPGVWLGQKTIPVGAAGCYVPGGRYPMVASAHMSIIPAKVAGVSRVAATTPPSGKEGPNPHMLYAMHHAGADELYSLGGVQALGALAFGTESIQPVDMLVGPGNSYVAEAKRQLFGRVGIDLIAGPTEILVIADESADPGIVAADLLAQAEHGPGSPAILVTTSEEVGQAVLREIPRQLEDLETRDVAAVAWASRGEVVVVESDEEAVRVADSYAAEHVEVQTDNWEWYFERLRNYGSLFLGEMATVAYGDKAIGTNHILPTMRNARFTGGLWVGKFLKTCTYQRIDLEGTKVVGPVVSRQCAVERFAGHRASVDRRLAKYGLASGPADSTAAS